jgi:hypothetical protein
MVPTHSRRLDEPTRNSQHILGPPSRSPVPTNTLSRDRSEDRRQHVFLNEIDGGGRRGMNANRGRVGWVCMKKYFVRFECRSRTRLEPLSKLQQDKRTPLSFPTPDPEVPSLLVYDLVKREGDVFLPDG